MVRQAFEVERADREVARPRVTRREIVSIRETLETLGDARCPLCRARLVARHGRAGPYFFCRCPLKRAG
jgi:hypothetical protein